MKYSVNHTVYYDKKHNEVPSATTILKILNKPALVRWANYLGFKHLDVESVVNETAVLGTAVHEIASSILSNDYIIYIPTERIPTAVMMSYIRRFKVWLNTNSVEPILLEHSLSVDKFGGTVDFYGKYNGKYTIIDFKTSKKIRITMFFQLAMYCMLLEEHGYPVEQVGIRLINPNVDAEKYISREELKPYIDVSRQLIDLFHSYYDLNDKLKWGDDIL